MSDSLLSDSSLSDSSLSDDHNDEEAILDRANSVFFHSDDIQKSSCAQAIMRLYVQKAAEIKTHADTLGAEIQEKQDHMRLINEIIAEINNMTDEKNCLDIGQNAELLEKLQRAAKLGVKVNEGQVTFNALERDRLIENLHLCGDNWDKENRSHTQKLEIYIKELDRLVMLMKDVDRKEEQSKRAAIQATRG